MIRGASILAGLLATASHAAAAFVGIVVVDTTDNSLGLKEYSIYCKFDNPSDQLAGITWPMISCTTTFYQSTVNGQVSALPWTVAQNAMADTPDVDSFLTIGLAIGDDNDTFIADPDNVLDQFLFGSSIVVDGWLQGPFPPLQGSPDANGLVLIAVLAPTNDATGKPGVISGSLKLTYASGGPQNGNCFLHHHPRPLRTGRFPPARAPSPSPPPLTRPAGIRT